MQVEKKEGILEKLKRKYRQMSRNTEPVTQEKEQPVDTHIAEINPYTFRKVEYPRKRINLLLPSINPEHVFGGISTALKFFEKLADELGYDRRIILVDAVPGEETRAKYRDRYTFAEWNEAVSYTHLVVADLAVRPKRASAEPEVQDTGAAAEDGSGLEEEHASPVVAPPEVETIDFESKLEESLKDL